MPEAVQTSTTSGNVDILADVDHVAPPGARITVLGPIIAKNVAVRGTDEDDSSGALSYNTIYNRFFIPRTVPEEVILGALILLVVVVMQFALVAGFAFASPVGRTRPGTPSLASRNPDPLDENRYG